MFRLYPSHLQALKGKIHTVSEQRIVGSPTLTIIRVYNKETKISVLPGLFIYF
jgi:tRNA A37 threonylcarbamoyladenosine biosynthesis protein TsaE